MISFHQFLTEDTKANLIAMIKMAADPKLSAEERTDLLAIARNVAKKYGINVDQLITQSSPLEPAQISKIGIEMSKILHSFDFKRVSIPHIGDEYWQKDEWMAFVVFDIHGKWRLMAGRAYKNAITDTTHKPLGEGEGEHTLTAKLKQFEDAYNENRRQYTAMGGSQVSHTAPAATAATPQADFKKLIVSSRWYYTFGSSDKVYNIYLHQVPSGFIASYEYGRRGSKLKGGNMSSRPVSRASAQGLYDDEVVKRRSKGYTTDPSGRPFS